MTEPLLYRQQILRAVDAFLEGTPASIAQGQRIINHCHAALRTNAQRSTLDGLIWDSYAYPLTDSVYFMSQGYLQEIRQILCGLPSAKGRDNIFITRDFRPFLTADEAEWYALLLDMLTFIQNIPFAQIAEATAKARAHNISAYVIMETISEAMPLKKATDTYTQKKKAIEALAASIPPPEQVGDETIYRLVLREVTDLLIAIDIRLSALYAGHPRPLPPYSSDGDDLDRDGADTDMSEALKWAKRVLDALSGKGTLFLSWKLARAASFDADLLLICLH